MSIKTMREQPDCPFTEFMDVCRGEDEFHCGKAIKHWQRTGQPDPRTIQELGEVTIHTSEERPRYSRCAACTADLIWKRDRIMYEIPVDADDPRVKRYMQ